jgi:hypothetical protein
MFKFEFPNKDCLRNSPVCMRLSMRWTLARSIHRALWHCGRIWSSRLSRFCLCALKRCRRGSSGTTWCSVNPGEP